MKGALDQFDYIFKIIFLGDSGVGKSNILQRGLRGERYEFQNNYQTTIGMEFANKIIITDKGTRIKFQMWDTAGQQRYRALMKTYYKGASAVFLIYDITKQQSLQSIRDHWQPQLKQFFKGNIITMLIGNKVDNESERQVEKKKGLELALQKNFAFYEVSAKTGFNTDLIFERMAEQLEKMVNIPKEVSQAKDNAQKQQKIGKKSEHKNSNIKLDAQFKNLQARNNFENGSRKKCC